MDRKTWMAALALFAVAAVYVVFFRKTEEDRIKAQLVALAEAVHKEPGENEMLRAMRVEKAFVHLFTKDVELSIPEVSSGRRARHELATLTVGAGHAASKIGLSYEGLHIEIEKPAARAWVSCTAVVSATLREGGGRLESREVVLRFVKEEDEWHISSVATPGGER